MYNGPRIHDTQVMEAPLAEQASQLLEPFIIHYVAGQVVGLSVRAGDEEWTINIKEGLASLLQMCHTCSLLHSSVLRYIIPVGTEPNSEAGKMV
jgi:UDP-glucose 4-epimerase